MIFSFLVLKFSLDFCISFLTTLNIYKAYFKSRQHKDRDQETYFLNEKLLCLYTIGFCNQVARISHILGSVQRVSHRLEICVSKERRLLQDQVQLGIGVNVQL